MIDLGIEITTMPSTRPADYYLCCLDGCVFLDFNNIDNQIYLKRISFDGFGCWSLSYNTIPLDRIESRIFRKMMQEQDINQYLMADIVRKIVTINKNLIDEEPLLKYNLLIL